MRIFLLYLCFCAIVMQLVKSAPPKRIYTRASSKHSKVKNNIWNAVNDYHTIGANHRTSVVSQDYVNGSSIKDNSHRLNKVIHLFPVPVDGECLSEDARRTGTCFNAYECRLKGGVSNGVCAKGFGVCCLFVATCNETVSNNMTYFVSPNFPSSMFDNLTSCGIKVKVINADISQLRIDFYQFLLGQPNRYTGKCDGDIFYVTGGPTGNFSLCGQNSGQHIYYEVAGQSLPRQTLYGTLRPFTYNQIYINATRNNTDEQLIEIKMNFTKRFIPMRLWEIRIVQIPFSQRAPSGCLQYHTGTEGIIQTFNYAENGRHLANQNYRICMRQEREMCSIIYQPCDEESFRIGSSTAANMNSCTNNDDATVASQSGITTDGINEVTSNTLVRTTTTTTTNIITENTSTSTTELPATNSTTTLPTSTSDVAVEATSSQQDDELEGSGDDDNNTITLSSDSNSSRPQVSNGGFDILGFFRSTLNLDFRSKYDRSIKTSRQLFSVCKDRITMPCIVEDFIGTGLGTLPGCEPIHCGSQFCSSGIWPCRIESTVIPFYIGIHFGNGEDKGRVEDNIGACLRFKQISCL